MERAFWGISRYLPYHLEDLQFHVRFNSVVLSPSAFYLFVSGTVNSTIYKFLWQGFKLFFGPIFGRNYHFDFEP